MPRAKERIFWISNIPVKKDTLEWINEQANRKGQKTGLTAGLLLDEMAQDHILHGMDHDGRTSSVWNAEWFMQRDRIMALSRYAARVHLNFPCDESEERLQQICDEAGVLSSEVIAEVSNELFSNAIISSGSQTLLSQCTEWLSETITAAGDEGIGANMVYTLAKESGFSGATLERAKRTINQNTSNARIKSFRDEVGWKWKVEVDETA